MYAAWKLIPSHIAGKETVRTTILYQNDDSKLTKSILILGDSTAAGVGAASPEQSTAGRLSHALNARVENHSKSGALVKDMEGQLKKAKESSYDLILLQIGANNIIYFKSLDAAAASLDALLPELRKRSSTVVLLTAGDVGKATLWPVPLGWFYTKRTLYMREKFMDLALKHGVKYLDLYSLPDPFLTDVPRYYAKDKLHLSGDGYAVWTGHILNLLNEKK